MESENRATNYIKHRGPSKIDLKHNDGIQEVKIRELFSYLAHVFQT